jgi:enoyl reductase
MTLNGRIAVARRFGPPEVIALESHPTQPLTGRQVRVAVRTGGLNPVDAHRRAGAFGGGVPTDGGLLHAKPRELGWELAGGLSGVGQSAQTALKALSLRQGDVIVVHGGAGGVGSVLVQLAAARGIAVIVTGSAENHEYLRSLGAIPVAYGAAGGVRASTLRKCLHSRAPRRG